MRPLLSRRVVLLGALVALLILAFGAAPAHAATIGHVLVPSADILGIGHAFGSVFSAIGGAVLGAFSWTISLASKFILVTLGALVRMLIPRSWANDAIQVFDWIVAIPDYAGRVTSPSGGHVYGFAGVNDMRELFQWLGIGLLPLTLVYATSRAMLGRGDHVAAPVARVVILAGLLVSYPYWWAQAAALTNQLTHLILSPAAVVIGIHKLMAYATEGVALGGWQLIDLGLMAALALELLALIFAKVVIILLGALMFATGPLMIGLVATESGDVIARGWISAVATLLMLPVAWAAMFALGAVLVDDASSAGPLIGGSSEIGSLLGGVIVAVAGAATLWLCLRAAREVGGLLRLQIGGLMVIAGRARSRTGTGAAAGSGASTRLAGAAGSIRGFQGKVHAAGTAALGAAGPKTGELARTAGAVGRRGLVIGGAGAAGSVALAAGRLAARSRVASAARPHLAGAAASAAVSAGPLGARAGRAGAVASRMARAGGAAWQQHGRSAASTSSDREGRASEGTQASGPSPVRAAARGASSAAPPRGGDGQQPPRTAPSARTAAQPTRPTGAATSEGVARDRQAVGSPARSAAVQPPTPRSRTRTARGSERPGPAVEHAPASQPPSSPARPRPRSGPSEQSSGRE